MKDGHARAERLVRSKFEAAISAADSTWLQEHVRGCAACAERHRRYEAAERALYPRADGLNPAALERVERRLMGSRGRRPSAPRWVAALALAGAVPAGLLLVPSAEPPPSEFRARGASEPVYGLRVLSVVEAPAGQVRVEPLDALEAVDPNARLVFLVTADRAALLEVFGDEQRLLSARVGEGADTRVGAPLEVPAAWEGRSVPVEARFLDEGGRVLATRRVEIRVGP